MTEDTQSRIARVETQQAMHSAEDARRFDALDKAVAELRKAVSDARVQIAIITTLSALGGTVIGHLLGWH